MAPDLIIGAQAEEIFDRLEKLEKQKISVKDLPVKALREALAKEPQDPVDLLLPGSVTSDLLAEDVFQPGAWTTPTMQNSWVQYLDANYSKVAYRQTSEGRVVLRGLVERAVAGSGNTTIMQLPPVLAPEKHQIFPCRGFASVSGETTHRIDVQSSGAVVYRGAESTVAWLSLDPISFYPYKE